MCLVSDGLLLHKYSEEMAFDLDLVALAEIGCFFFRKVPEGGEEGRIAYGIYMKKNVFSIFQLETLLMLPCCASLVEFKLCLGIQRRYFLLLLIAAFVSCYSTMF